jgi:hypothetical protein
MSLFFRSRLSRIGLLFNSDIEPKIKNKGVSSKYRILNIFRKLKNLKNMRNKAMAGLVAPL